MSKKASCFVTRCVAAILWLSLSGATGEAKVTSYLTGNAADVDPAASRTAD